MIFVVWFWFRFSKDILAKRNKGRAIKEICTFRLAITDGQCYVVWISGMLFGWLIEAKQLTILKGTNNFFFLLCHLWYVYAFFTYAQVKNPLGFPLIMIKILFFLKEVLYLLNEIYIYIYIYIYVKGHITELALPIHKVSWV